MSEGQVTYQQLECYDSATEGRINFKPERHEYIISYESDDQ